MAHIKGKISPNLRRMFFEAKIKRRRTLETQEELILQEEEGGFKVKPRKLKIREEEPCNYLICFSILFLLHFLTCLTSLFAY